MTIIRLWRGQLAGLLLVWGSATLAYGQGVPISGRQIERCDIAEPDTSCCNCAGLRLVLSQRTSPTGEEQQGVMFRGYFWRCDVCRFGASLRFGLTNGPEPGTALTLYCDEAFGAGEPFNRRVNGRKEGIWFTYNQRLRVVASASVYEKGEKLREVLFWPNGIARQVTAYRDGKNRRTGFHRYNEQGYPVYH